MLPLSFGIIRDEYPRDKINSGLSVVASLAAVGFGIGIVAAGPIVEVLSYHWLFWIPMVTTALAALGAATLVPESPVRTPGRIPLLPAALLSAWLLALLLGLSQGNPGAGVGRVLALFAGAIILAAAWIVVETRVPVPLIDMRMMRRRGVWTANAVAGFVGFGVYASFGFLPQFLQTPSEAGYGFGATLTESGHLLLPSAVASFLMGFTDRAVREEVRHSRRRHVRDARQRHRLRLDRSLARRNLAGVRCDHLPGHRHGPGVLEPRRRGHRRRAAGADGRRERDEREHPHHRGSVGSAVMAGVVTARLGPTACPSRADT